MLFARSIKQGGLRMQACIVRPSLCIGDSVQIRGVGSSAGRAVVAKAQRRDGLLLIALGKLNAFLDKLGREH